MARAYPPEAANGNQNAALLDQGLGVVSLVPVGSWRHPAITDQKWPLNNPCTREKIPIAPNRMLKAQNMRRFVKMETAATEMAI